MIMTNNYKIICKEKQLLPDFEHLSLHKYFDKSMLA
jgi:hypothetical protein